MDLLGVLQEINRQTNDAGQPTDLQIGTVTKAPPDDDELEIQISEAMAPLKQAVLYLAEPVIEKKIPILRHRHEIKILQHKHATPSGLSEDAFTSPPYFTEWSALPDGFDAKVQAENFVGWENGAVLPLSKDKKYIILNPALKVGDKVLLLRVQSGQKFIVLSRVYGGDS